MSGFPRHSSYGQYSSYKYGSHCQRFDCGSMTIWYSYTTPVAFWVVGHNLVVRQNDWGPTTGKHLNWIDGGNKKLRVDSDTFKRLWREQGEPLFRKEPVNPPNPPNPV